MPLGLFCSAPCYQGRHVDPRIGQKQECELSVPGVRESGSTWVRSWIHFGRKFRIGFDTFVNANREYAPRSSGEKHSCAVGEVSPTLLWGGLNKCGLELARELLRLRPPPWSRATAPGVREQHRAFLSYQGMTNISGLTYKVTPQEGWSWKEALAESQPELHSRSHAPLPLGRGLVTCLASRLAEAGRGEFSVRGQVGAAGF